MPSFDRTRATDGSDAAETSACAASRLGELVQPLIKAGVHSRLIEQDGEPLMLRSWKPAQVGNALIVVCVPYAHGDDAESPVFRYHPEGGVIAVADQPAEAAAKIAADLEAVARRVGA